MFCAQNNNYATFTFVQGRSHSLGDRGAFHLAMIACVCFVMALLVVSPTSRPGSADWLTQQIDERVEQYESPDQTDVPMEVLDVRFAEDLHEEVVELTESTDDDETARCLLQFDEVPALDVPTLESHNGFSESSSGRALTPFRLRAFSTRGSPSA